MIGRALGHYEVGELLGSGGMGEVYRARDTKLDRDVAIKVLPDDLAADPGRLARFEREAKLLAALNHSNIGAIHGLEESDGVRFLVLELIHGETLAQRLQAGALPVPEALEIARQIAAALEAAHDAGIIHRDVKPANVLVTPRGGVKVLDFGIAKSTVPGGELEATAQATGLTEDGALMGTPPYMSPERIRGKEADKRADIWAFGCVLYEMLAGKQPFHRETVADTLAAILEQEPDWEALPKDTPASIRRLLQRCLRKPPTDRLQHIGDARIVLNEGMAGSRQASDEPHGAAHQAAGTRFGRSHRLAAAGAVLLLAVGTVAVLWRASTLSRSIETTAVPSGVLAWDIVLPRGVSVRSSVYIPFRTLLAVSPVGSHIAYAAVIDEVGQDHIYLRALRYPESTETLVAGSGPFFSPDGRSLGYFSGNQLKRISLAGEGPSTICDVPPGTAAPRSAVWAPDGTIFFSFGNAIMRVDANGGNPEPVPMPDDDRDRNWLQILPDGRTLVYALSGPETVSFDDAEIAVLDFASGEEKVLPLRGSYPYYLNTGHLVYARDGTIRAARFDLERLEVQGEPATVMQGVMTTKTTGVARFAFNQDSMLAYVPGPPEADRSLVWVDRDGRPMPVTDERRGYFEVTMSPDGRRLAVTIGWRNHDVWIYELANKTWNRLTRGWDEHWLAWTPDSERVVFSSDRAGGRNLFWAPADGSSEPEPLLPAGQHPRRPRSISTDYRWLAYVETHPSTGADLWLLPLSPQGAAGDPRPFLGGPYGQGGTGGAISPDGQWIAYTTNDSGETEIKVTSFPEPGAVLTVSSAGGSGPKWVGSGAELFFSAPGSAGFMAARARSGAGIAFEPARLLFSDAAYRLSGGYGYDVTPDGERFVMILQEEPLEPTHFKVIPNWGEELKRLLPAPR